MRPVIKKTYLPARAMGLAPTGAAIKGLAPDSGLKAVLRHQQFELQTSELPKFDDSIDAVAWQLIGFEDIGRRFEAKSVKTELFNRALGNHPEVDFRKAVT